MREVTPTEAVGALAAQVLAQAAADAGTQQAVMHPFVCGVLEYWCAMAGVDYEAYRDRLAQIVNTRERLAAHGGRRNRGRLK